jgi:hypothetical protein
MFMFFTLFFMCQMNRTNLTGGASTGTPVVEEQFTLNHRAGLANNGSPSGQTAKIPMRHMKMYLL